MSDSDSPYTIDPIDDFCTISGQGTLILDQKLYITPGYSYYRDNLTRGDINSSPWIRVIDLSRPINLNRTAEATTVLPPSIVPVKFPDVQGAAFWWDEGSSSIVYAQGFPTIEGGVIRDSDNVYFGRPGKAWYGKYDKSTKEFETWREIDTPFPGTSGMITSLRHFFDPIKRTGHIYGGGVNAADGSGGPRAQFVTYDAVGQTWSNKTVPQGSFDSAAIAIPYRTVGGKLLGIVFGGQLNGVYLNMDTIFIHDIEADEWFRQDATGEIPKERSDFCATYIMAPDNSSMQIFTYGGYGDGHFSDVYALSLPAFEWTRLEERSPDFVPGPGIRLQPSCQMVNDRFLTIFGGRNLVGGDTAFCDLNQNALFMYDLQEREWILDYDPSAKGYSIPQEVYQAIGGNASGYATMTVPSKGFAAETMTELFAIAASTTTSLPTETDAPPLPTQTGSPGSSKSNTGAIAGGVVGGVVVLAIIGFLFWFLRRRSTKRHGQDPPVLPEAHPPMEVEGFVPTLNEVDAFPSRPKIVELTGDNVQKPSGIPPIELPVVELPAEPRQLRREDYPK